MTSRTNQDLLAISWILPEAKEPLQCDLVSEPLDASVQGPKHHPRIPGANGSGSSLDKPVLRSQNKHDEKPFQLLQTTSFQEGPVEIPSRYRISRKIQVGYIVMPECRIELP